VTIDEIRQLVDLVQQSAIAELEITRGDDAIRIVHHHPQVAAPAGLVASGAPAAAAPAPAPAAAEAAPPAGRTDLYELKAPMVGTFYRAPSPESPPYAQVGDRVTEGQTVCIIEAMKLMNEIPIDRSGTVIEIACENADPVEYGQVLIRIEPD